MAGTLISKNILNRTLIFILKILNDNKIKNWFIGYGTLLGIVRENSCIDGDDDVDIVIDKNNYNKVKELLIKNNFTIEYSYGINKNRNILKTKPKGKFCSVDFYMATLDKEGNFNDTWEEVIWGKCFNENNELIKYKWNEHLLYLPFNYEEKLVNRYGEEWKITMKSKGPFPRKRIL